MGTGALDQQIVFNVGSVVFPAKSFVKLHLCDNVLCTFRSFVMSIARGSMVDPRAAHTPGFPHVRELDAKYVQSTANVPEIPGHTLDRGYGTAHTAPPSHAYM